MSPEQGSKPETRIVSQVRRNETTMDVTYVFPDGRRATIGVPYDRWLAGGHAPLGRRLTEMLDGLHRARVAARGKLPE